mmetsp:Transcript_20748/g.50144  ORF Transcript_20748/g.50144 Transcript_20748/m.50144 type:complete len:142 (-) Transcript_20748:160-585(-)
MGRGGKDVRAATPAKDAVVSQPAGKAPIKGSAIPAETPVDAKAKKARKVKEKPLIQFIQPDMGRMPQGEQCISYPREGLVKKLPARIAPPRPEFDVEDTGYTVRPSNPHAVLPQVEWRDPSECLEEFVKGSQMPRAVYLGL